MEIIPKSLSPIKFKVKFKKMIIHGNWKRFLNQLIFPADSHFPKCNGNLHENTENQLKPNKIQGNSRK